MRREVQFIFLKNAFMDEGLKQVVDVIAAEVGVAIGREDLIDIAFGGGDEFENGDIKRAAAEIVDGYAATLLFVQAIREGGGGGFIDEAKDFEARDFAGVFGGLALGIVEIGGDGDDGAVDRFVEEGFGPAFEFAQDERGNFWRRENFVAEHDADYIF